MDVSAEEFQRLYASMSDEGLRSLERDDLVDVARECYDLEFARRGLRLEAAPDSTEYEELVPVATFTFPGEASLARALLDAASIPSHLQNEHSWNKTEALVELRLLVPALFHAEAMEILGSQVSDGDLDAQAEAAGSDPEVPE